MDETCPGCRGPLRPDSRRPSVSRTDNETFVCSACGEMEALLSYGFDQASAREIVDAGERARAQMLWSAE